MPKVSPTKKSPSRKSPAKKAAPKKAAPKKAAPKKAAPKKAAPKKAAPKKAAPKKAAPKKAAPKKAAPKKAAPKKKTATNKAAPMNVVPKTTKAGTKIADAKVSSPPPPPRKKAVKKTTPLKTKSVLTENTLIETEDPVVPSKPAYPKAFMEKQRLNLLSLRDEMVGTMHGVARGNLGEHADGNEASAFGTHQADAGSDAYDRDLALNLLSQEQNALYEIDEALVRLSNGTYGYCEVSGAIIMKERLEAIPFARLTVECQSQVEKENRLRGRAVQGPIFKRSHL
jgi:RNA polymerase-binding transcription factor DksA